MPRNLATAIWKSASASEPTIDRAAGILRGVKLMELGKVATFSGEDGKPKSVKITDAHIDALLAHAGNRALPMHETHEWFDAQGGANADSIERAARIGSLKAFRKDDAGNLIADAYLNLAKPESQALLFGAEHNPEDNCFSVVFSYDKSDPLCIPQNFRAADIVPQGAATTALFSESDSPQTSTKMDINELVEALKDPKVQAAVSAIIKSHKADAPDEPDGDEAAAEMESAAGVTDADKKDEDSQKPALMRAALRCERARNRKLAEFIAGEKTALLAEVKTAAKAESTALLGKGGFQIPASGTEPSSQKPTALFAAAVKELTDKGVKEGAATLAVMKAKPDLFNAVQIERGIFKAK